MARVGRTGQCLVPHLIGGMGQQGDTDAGLGEREAAADPVLDRCRVPGRQALDEYGLMAVAYCEEDVLAGDLVQVLHERERSGSQSVTAGSQRRDFKQMQANDEFAVIEAFEGAHTHQLGRDSRRGALGKTCSSREPVERQAFPGFCEGTQDPERPLQNRLTVQRPS